MVKTIWISLYAKCENEMGVKKKKTQNNTSEMHMELLNGIRMKLVVFFALFSSYYELSYGGSRIHNDTNQVLIYGGKKIN